MPQPGRGTGITNAAPAGDSNQPPLGESKPRSTEHGNKKPKKDGAKKEGRKNDKDKGVRGEKKERKQRKDAKTSKEYRPVTSPTGPTRRLSPGATGNIKNGGSAKIPTVVGNPAMNGTTDGVSKAKDVKRTKRKGERRQGGLWWLLKIIAAVFFGVAYAVLVVFLTMQVVKAKASASKGDNSAACQILQCPSDSVCVTSDTGRARCNENSYQNMQILQVILGIVVGVPAIICLPCSAQWLVRSGAPWLRAWYTERKRRWRVASSTKVLMQSKSREKLATESPRADGDLEPGEIQEGPEEEARLTEKGKTKAEDNKGGLLAKLCARTCRLPCLRRKESQSGPISDHQAAVAVIATGGAAEAVAGGGDDDDDLDAFFAPMAKKKQESTEEAAVAQAATPGGDAGDDFLDLIFASKRPADNLPPPMPPADDGLAPPDDDDLQLGSLFAKPAKASAQGGKGVEAGMSRDRNANAADDAESFADFFHKPARRAPQQAGAGGMPPMPAANPGRGTALPPVPASAPRRQQEAEQASRTDISAGLSAIFASAKRRAPASRSSAGGSRAASASVASSAQEDYDDGDFEEEEGDEALGEAPDFIGFALGIARGAAGAAEEDGESLAAGTDIFATDRSRQEVDARSDTSAADSLAGLEESLHSELFHPPV